MISIILMILGFIYIAINLVLFGMALVVLPEREALRFLFFGTLILISEFFVKPWIK